MHAFTREELRACFTQIDTQCDAPLSVTILGGAAIVLLGFRDRATIDIDIAATVQAQRFQHLGRALSIPVDIITVSSTVDLLHCPTTTVFQGTYLHVAAVTALDLIKLKLERFQKHDAEDIYAIIIAIALSFEQFAAIATDMRIDYLGNPRTLALSICLVTERMYPEHLAAMERMMLSPAKHSA